MWDEAAIARAAELACRIEVSAPKPGNVGPDAAFADMSDADLLASAAAVAPVIGGAGRRPVGETMLQAVRATRRVVGVNTNLGIILLLTPLARAAALVRRTPPAAGEKGRLVPLLRRALAGVLRSLDVADAERTYRAIRLAGPGGMGHVSEQDLERPPTVTLLEAMRLAAGRDAVAREYVTDFEITFTRGVPLLRAGLAHGLHLEAAVVETFLNLLAEVHDTLLERKLGRAAAAAVSARAAAVLAAGEPGTPGRAREAARMDRWLRDRPRPWNPGTTADLVAGSLFVWLLTDEDATRHLPAGLRSARAFTSDPVAAEA